ncbi:MAG: glycosyltransferase, partial [Planctomycetes bacterium]|nr:glycosyltransferase [Planctomycetota bacterium]
AFCITDLDPGGAEQALVQLATRLDRSRWSPRVWCLTPPGKLVAELESAGIESHCLGARSALDLSAIWRLIRDLRRFRPQILQCFLHHANIAGRLAGRVAGAPHIVCGLRVAEKRGRWRLRIDRWTGRLVDRWVAVSRSVARFSIEAGGLPSERVVVIPNGIDFGRFSTAPPADLSEFGLRSGERAILFAGRLDHQKGIPDLLEACDQVLSDTADTHLLIAGAGPLETLVGERIRESPSGTRMHLIGRRDDLPRLLRAAAVFVLPSRWEGLPNVVLEAMSAGCPVVATAVEGSSEVIDDGRTGLLTPVAHPQSLAAAIQRILAEPNLADALGHEAQAIAMKWLTWHDVALRYEQLYGELLGL